MLWLWLLQVASGCSLWPAPWVHSLSAADWRPEETRIIDQKPVANTTYCKYIHTNIHVYMHVCVCVCVFLGVRRKRLCAARAAKEGPGSISNFFVVVAKNEATIVISVGCDNDNDDGQRSTTNKQWISINFAWKTYTHTHTYSYTHAVQHAAWCCVSSNWIKMHQLLLQFTYGTHTHTYIRVHMHAHTYLHTYVCIGAHGLCVCRHKYFIIIKWDHILFNGYIGSPQPVL